VDSYFRFYFHVMQNINKQEFAWVIACWQPLLTVTPHKCDYARLCSVLVQSLLAQKTRFDIVILCDQQCYNDLNQYITYWASIASYKEQVSLQLLDTLQLIDYQWKPTYIQSIYYSKEFNQTIFNKFQALKLVKYNKIALLDSDMIAFVNTNCSQEQHCDSLLTSTDAPASCFWNAYSKTPDIYGMLQHNQIVNSVFVMQQLNTFRGFVGSGAVLILTPDVDVYHDFMKWIQSYCNRPYGNERSLAGIEEQAITKYFITRRNVDWHHISTKFCAIPWKLNSNECEDISQSIFLHYIHTPPFNQDIIYDDTRFWWNLEKSLHLGVGSSRGPEDQRSRELQVERTNRQ
jgi:hypothetical protein